MSAKAMAAGMGASLLLLAASACTTSAPSTAVPIAEAFTPAALADACEGRSGWSDPAPPAHLYGNSWLVGTCGITAVLVTSDKGHMLIDGGPPEAAPLIAANIARLGYRIGDVRRILSSHEHFDHAGGIAELQRLSGAKVAALAASAPVFTTGKPAADDPQLGELPDMAPINVERVLHDGEQVTLGPLVMKAHATPAHSPGSTSWTWTSCDGTDCRIITYADSISTISAVGYRFSDHPGRIEAVNTGLRRVAGLPCGILITPHPSASDMFGRFASGAALDDPAACKTYAAKGAARFAERLAGEAAQ